MIDKYEYKDRWFQPVFFADTWQVAILNYAEEQAVENLKKLDVHLKTDEVFILQSGVVAIITADILEKPYQYCAEIMKPGIIYNVAKNVWHNIAMKPGSSVYIIENKDTHLSDFEFHNLDVTEKTQLCNIVNEAWSSAL